MTRLFRERSGLRLLGLGTTLLALGVGGAAHADIRATSGDYRVNSTTNQCEIRIALGEQIKFAAAKGGKPDLFLGSWVSTDTLAVRGKSLFGDLVAKISFTSQPDAVGIADGIYHFIYPASVLNNVPCLSTDVKTAYQGLMLPDSSLTETINNPNLPVVGTMLELSCDWAGRVTGAEQFTWCAVTGGKKYTNVAYANLDGGFTAVPHAADTATKAKIAVNRFDSIFQNGDFTGNPSLNTFPLYDQYGAGAGQISTNYNPGSAYQLHNQDPTGTNNTTLGPRNLTSWSHLTPFTQNSWANDYVFPRVMNTGTTTLYGHFAIYAWDEVPTANGSSWSTFHRKASSGYSWDPDLSITAGSGGAYMLFAENPNEKAVNTLSPLGSRYLANALMYELTPIVTNGPVYPLNNTIKVSYPFRKKHMQQSTVSLMLPGAIDLTPAFKSELITKALEGVSP